MILATEAKSIQIVFRDIYIVGTNLITILLLYSVKIALVAMP